MAVGNIVSIMHRLGKGTNFVYNAPFLSYTDVMVTHLFAGTSPPITLIQQQSRYHPGVLLVDSTHDK